MDFETYKALGYLDDKIPTYYHYFGFVKALEERKEIYEKYGYIFLNDKTLLFYPPKHAIPDNIKEIKVSTIAPRKHNQWEAKLYDRNYIYDLGYTLKIESFVKNAKRFNKENIPDFLPITAKEAWIITEHWYQYKLKKYSEFHMVETELYLIENFPKFGLNLWGVFVPNIGWIGVSLWGEFKDDIAIHIVSKDIGALPYAQDFLRYKTYHDMKSRGFNYVIDGSDLGFGGLRKYKTKLRPYLIIPVWSWVRKGGDKNEKNKSKR